jgi:hypothetical protein
MNPINQMNQKNQTDQKNQMNQIGREPQLRVSQSRGSRGVDAQATRRQQPGEGPVGSTPESRCHWFLRRESSSVSAHA